jgi:hypothetical protein
LPLTSMNYSRCNVALSRFHGSHPRFACRRGSLHTPNSDVFASLIIPQVFCPSE